MGWQQRQPDSNAQYSEAGAYSCSRRASRIQVQLARLFNKRRIPIVLSKATSLAALLFCLTATLCAQAPIDGREQLEPVPSTCESELKLSPFCVSAGKDGLEPTGEFPTAQGLTVQRYRGIGVNTKAGDGRVIDVISKSNYVGVKLGSSDSEVALCRLFGNRDVCLWIAPGAGNCQSVQNHCYGARIACLCQGEMFRSVNDTFADSPIGFWGDGGDCSITNALFQNDAIRCAVLRGGWQNIYNSRIRVQRNVKEFPKFSVPGMQEYDGTVGVEVGGGCSIVGGRVVLTNWKHPLHNLSGKPSEAVWIVGDDTVVDTHIVDADDIDGSVAIRIKDKRRGCKVD